MTKREWDSYVAHELERARPRIASLGFSLDELQPHLGGERYLMQAVTSVSGPKLILLGTRSADGLRVVVKATSHPAGIREIETERRCRAALRSIRFSYRRFFAPEELCHDARDGMVIAVQEFVEQDSAFLERPIEEQFALALDGLKTQEGAHATTYGHLRRIQRVFPLWRAREYLAAARRLAGAAEGLEDALAFLGDGATVVEQYSGFLTHSDFVPHNMRIRAGTLYLLDHASLRFGNKYEGWARFVNFMELYHPPLARALVEYVRANRAPEESRALVLMRVFRLIEIVAYYASAAERSEGDLRELNQARIKLWRGLLASVMRDEPLDPVARETYIRTRDALRSEEEKRRQQGLH